MYFVTCLILRSVAVCRNAAAASQQATAVSVRAKLARRSWPCRADSPPNDIAARAGGPAHYWWHGPVFRRLRVGQRLHGKSHTRGKPNFVVKADDGHRISDVAGTGRYTELSAMILIDFPLLYTAIVNAVLSHWLDGSTAVWKRHCKWMAVYRDGIEQCGRWYRTLVLDDLAVIMEVRSMAHLKVSCESR